ncbi:MAG: OmpA family protein [Bacteroidota bacterium]
MKYTIAIILFLFTQILTAQINEAGLPVEEEIRVYPLKSINSDYRDVNISITPNGKYLYFMSGRGGAVWSTKGKVKFKGKPEYDGDIWFSEKQDTTWKKPKYLPAGINTSRGEDEPNISPDGQTVHFQSWSIGFERTGGPYYKAELYGKKWRNPRGLDGGITRFFRDSFYRYDTYATDGMSISPDGRIFIVAAGVVYDGNLDLYISRKDNRGNWSYPERLPISTKADERSIFIAGDNRTIYFGSSGHGGAGGLDIFKATLNDDNSCTDLINIGAPFNTEEDDYGFIIGALGSDAYFVRESDIYYADLGNAKSEIKPQATILINGIVKDCDGNEVQSAIELYSLTENQLIANARSNAITGEYAFSLPRLNGDYVQRVKLFSDQSIIRQPFSIDINTASELFFEIDPSCDSVEVVAKKPQPTLAYKEPLDTTILLYFDFDKSNLKTSEQAKVDSILHFLEVKGRYFAEVIGHTDAKGSDEYNVALSKRRADVVAQYLKSKDERFTYNLGLQFKGEKEPILENSSAKNRAKNRRVLLRIADALE